MIAVSHKTIRVGAITIIAALLLRLVFFPGDTGASTATFHPEACLGGWQEANQAAGQPDFDDPTPTSYSRSNSAWLPSGSSAELFCGNFIGAIPDNGLPRGVSVQLNWVFRYDEGPSIETDILDTEVPIVISIDETPSGTEADMASSTAPSLEVGSEVEPGGESPSSTPEALEEVTTEEAESETVSLIQRAWQRLIPIARAQEATTTDPAPDEVPAEEAPAAEPEPAPVEEEVSETVPDLPISIPISTPAEVASMLDVAPESVAEAIDEQSTPTAASSTEAGEPEEEVAAEPMPEADEVASTTDSETASSTASTTEEDLGEVSTAEPIESTPDVFLEIFYTMDGEEFPLGFASLEDATGKTLILPDAVLDDWTQVADLQIGIRTIPILAETPTVYLESIALSVEYEEFELVELEDQPAPTEVIDLGEVEFIETKKPAFSAGENPVIEIDTVQFEIEADTARARYEENQAQERARQDEEAAAQVEAALEVLDATSWFPGAASSTSTTAPSGVDAPAEEETPPVVEPPESEPADEAAAASTTAGILYGPLPDNQALSFFERIFTGLRTPTVSAATTRARVYDVKVNNPEGKPTDLRPVVEETSTGLRVVLPKQPGSFVPGKYQVEMFLEQDGVLYRAQTSFVWGVLALNTDQDVYRLGESVDLQAAVLTETGHTVCTAAIAIRVEDPSGTVSTLSTQNGLVRQSGECGANNVTDVPDYRAVYALTSRVGVYEATIQNLDNGYEVTTSFRVVEAPVAIISRSGATRINPIAAYTVRAEAQIFERFSGRVVERVPSEFEIISHNANKVATKADGTYLEWSVDNALPGDRVAMEYTYQAPLVSPYFYELGPVVLYEKGLGRAVFSTEARTWQIASDAVGDGDMAIYTDTANTHDINNTSWTGVPFNNQVTQDGTYTQNANDIDVDLAYDGHYLYGYNISVLNSGYNNRVNFMSRVTLGGTAVPWGYGQGYQRNNSNDSYSLTGAGIVQATAGQDLRVEAQRVGSNNPGTQTVDRASFWLLKLDSTWEYLRLSQSETGNSTAMTTSWLSVPFTAIDELDSGYSYTTSSAAVMGVTNLQAMQGTDGGWSVYYGTDALAGGVMSVSIEEDTYADSERDHTTETVGYWAFGTSTASTITNSAGTTIGEFGKIDNLGTSSTTVNFLGSLTDPVILTTYNIDSSAEEPALVRVTGVDSSGFEAYIQDATAAAAPTADDVFWVAIEAGTHTLAGGVDIQVGTTTVSGLNSSAEGWNAVEMEEITVDGSITGSITVFGQIQTTNDLAWQLFWTQDGTTNDNPPSTSGVYVGRHIGADTTDTDRNAETVGYVIAEIGSDTMSTGVDYDIGETGDVVIGVTETPTVINPSVGAGAANVITLDSGKYLVTYNVGFESSSNRSVGMTRLELDGTPIEQSYSYTYMRGENSNGTGEGVASAMVIIDVPSDNSDLALMIKGSDDSPNQPVLNLDETAIAIVKLPDDADYLRVHESGGGQTVGAGTNDIILHDTEDEEDTDSFSHDTGTGRVTINQDGDYLFTFGSRTDRNGTSGTRNTAEYVWFKNAVEQAIGGHVYYIRGTENSGGTTFEGGGSTFALFNGLVSTDVIDIRNDNEGQDGGSQDEFQADQYGITAVNIDTLFASGTPSSTQTHFRWIYDNGSETGADNRAAEDTAITGLNRFVPVRLRFQVSNEGTGDTAGEQYRLEHSGYADTCSSGSYTRLDSSSEWEIVDTKEYTDGTASTDVAGRLSNANTAFVAGELKDTSDQTSTITLTSSEYTEIEYTIRARENSAMGEKYCFRLTNAGTPLEAYDVYAEATLKPGNTPESIYRSVGNTTSSLEATPVTMELATNTVTFSADPTNGADNIGVGDVIVYSDGGTTYAAFIHGRTSSTVYTVANYVGDYPHAVSAGTAVDGIYRAFTGVNDWESQNISNVNSSITATDNIDDEVLYRGTGDRNLTAQNIVAHAALYADAVDAPTVKVSFDEADWTTSATSYMRLFTPTLSSQVGSSQRHDGTAGTGYVLRPSLSLSGEEGIVVTDVDFIRFEGIELDGSSVTDGERLSGFDTTSNGGSAALYFTDLLVHSITNSTFDDTDESYAYGIRTSNNGGSAYVANNFIYNITNVSTNASASAGGIVKRTGSSGTVYIYNNTIFNVTDTGSSAGEANGIERNIGTVIAKNNYVGGSVSTSGSSYDFRGNFSSGTTNNVCSDTTCSDDADQVNEVTGQSSYATYFQDASTSTTDLHLTADSNTLWGSYGADLDNDANYPVATDIDGDMRDTTTPDIGADEYDAPLAATLTQAHYRWIFNNEDEDEADSQYGEDATSTAVTKNDIQRLRFQVSNEGTASSAGETYRLEVSEANPGTCSAGTYERLSTDTDWSMADSKEFSDGTATTNVVGRLTDENTTFVAGELKDTGDQASSVTLTTTQFTELEYAVIAENAATDGATYCFRLTNAGTELDAYDQYAVAVVKSDPTTIFRSVGNTTSDLESSEVTVTISTTTATFSADPTGGTANIGVGDVIVYTEDAVVHAAFITGRTSATEYSVANYTGGAPHKVATNAVDGIYRGFTSVSDWENQSAGDVNDSIPATDNVDDEVTYAGTGDKDLAAQNILAKIALYKDAVDTSTISIDSGWGTASTTYPYLYTPTSTSEVGTSQRHDGTAGTGYVNAPLTTATGFAIVNRVSADYVRIEGIESSGANLSDGEYVRWWHVDQDGGDTYFTHNLMYDLTNSTFDDSDSSAMIGFEHIGDGDAYLVNNIMYDFENVSTFATSFVNAIRHTAGSGNVYAYNNTIYDMYDSGSSSGSAEGFTTAGGGGRIYKNNYVGYVRSDSGTATAYDAGADAGSTHNASFDASCDDDVDMLNCVQNLDSYSSYFVSTTPGSIDLHLVGDTSSIWGSSGADLDNDAIYPVVDDIDGEARDATTPDIGADEISGTPDVTQTHYRWRNDDGVESGAAEWYDSSWGYRVPLTVQSSEIDSTLTDFPIYVDMSDLPVGFFSNVASDGADIRITDSTGTTSLPLEVVEISTASSTGEFHFKASSLSSSSDTTFYIYYGNATATIPLATSTYGSQNVWTEYVGVWHNNEDPSTDDIVDSTGNNDGTPNVNMTSDDRVGGRLGGGYALQFDGDDYVDISPDGGVLDINGSGQTLTLCAWALVEVDDTPTSWPPIFAKGDTQYVLKLNNGGGWEFKTNGAYFTDGNPDLDTWYYLCGRNNGGTNNLFIDSVLQGNSSSASSIGNQTHEVWMGRDSQNPGRSPYWQGMIDEVRISTESLSADWIESEYTNQSSPNTFYSVGTQETESTEATWAAAEDTAYTTFTAGTTKRLRFQVSNEGSASAGNLNFRLEVSEADPGSCSSASYTRIDSSSTWTMATSSHMSDGDATEDVASGLTNENATFVAGEYVINDDESSTSTLSTVQFSELEYVVQPTLSAAGSDFCFRLTDGGDVLDTYDIYAEATVLGQTLSFSISDYVIGFGDVLPSGARFATGDTSGTSTAAVAHTISATTDAASGYTITVQGATLEDGALAIDAIGGTAASPNPGTEQFGMRYVASGGTGAVVSPYSSGSLYAFLADAPDTIATLASGDGVETVYSAYYLASVAALTEPGNYSTVLQYTITANF